MGLFRMLSYMYVYIISPRVYIYCVDDVGSWKIIWVNENSRFSHENLYIYLDTWHIAQM